MSQPGCGFSGNPDLYGLGVRLGAYLLWYSTQIAYFFKLDGAGDLSESWTIFSLALSIAIYILTFQQQDADSRAYPAEIAIMLYMIFGGLFGTRGVGSRQQRRLRPVWWHRLLEITTNLVALVYAAWFWIAGESGDYFQQRPECETSIFLFSKIPQGSFRGVSIFFGVLAVHLALSSLIELVSIAYTGFGTFLRKPLDTASKHELLEYVNTECHGFLVDLLEVYGWKYPNSSMIRLVDIEPKYLVVRSKPQEPPEIIPLEGPLPDLRDKAKIKKYLEGISIVNHSDKLEEADDDKIPARNALLDMFANGTDGATKYINQDSEFWRIIRFISPGFAFIYSAYAVIAIELMIIWNGIDDVYDIRSTGQLIPFVIGVVGLFKALHDVHFEFKVRLLCSHRSFYANIYLQRQKLEKRLTRGSKSSFGGPLKRSITPQYNDEDSQAPTPQAERAGLKVDDGISIQIIEERS